MSRSRPRYRPSPQPGPGTHHSILLIRTTRIARSAPRAIHSGYAICAYRHGYYRVATVRPGAARPRIRPDRDLSQSAYAARCCLRTPPPVARRPSATNSQWRRRWASIKSSDVAGAGAAAQSHARRASTIVGTCEHTRLEWRRISKASHQAMPLACASAPESPCQKHV